ncbi:hypothetical protein K439DRAFT_1619544 [Ramaria rubella]|nr:hypothetical protein K439DRAFT_1619544 [Ramaria rubella]
MASTHPVHREYATYSQPEVQIPYPTEPVNYVLYPMDPDEDPDHESLTGETKGDETTEEERLMPQALFSNAVLDRIGIGPGLQQSVARENDRTSVLIPVPRSAQEEKELHESVMASLRRRIAALEEEELLESSMRGFTQRADVADVAVDGSVGLNGGGHGTVRTGAGLGFVGASNSAGLGDQLRPGDVRELLRADVRAVWAREREREAKEV